MSHSSPFCELAIGLGWRPLLTSEAPPAGLAWRARTPPQDAPAENGPQLCSPPLPAPPDLSRTPNTASAALPSPSPLPVACCCPGTPWGLCRAPIPLSCRAPCCLQRCTPYAHRPEANVPAASLRCASRTRCVNLNQAHGPCASLPPRSCPASAYPETPLPANGHPASMWGRPQPSAGAQQGQACQGSCVTKRQGSKGQLSGDNRDNRPLTPSRTVGTRRPLFCLCPSHSHPCW